MDYKERKSKVKETTNRIRRNRKISKWEESDEDDHTAISSLTPLSTVEQISDINEGKEITENGKCVGSASLLFYFDLHSFSFEGKRFLIM